MYLVKPMWKKLNKQNLLTFVIEAQNVHEEVKVKKIYKIISQNNFPGLSECKKSIYVLIPFNIYEIEQGLRCLRKIYLEESELNRIKEKKEEEIFILKLDILIRISAYLNIIYCLDGVVWKTFNDLERFAKILGIKDFDYEKEKELRKKEVENEKFWRNKVFAHTSYQDSGQDSIGTQASSLLYFAANACCYSEDGKRLCVGGVSVGDNVDSRFKKNIDIVRDYLKLEQHFKNWEEMFCDLIGKIEQNKGKLFKRCKMHKSKNPYCAIKDLETGDRI